MSVVCDCKNTCSRVYPSRGFCPCRQRGELCVVGPGGCSCSYKLPCSNVLESPASSILKDGDGISRTFLPLPLDDGTSAGSNTSPCYEVNNQIPSPVQTYYRKRPKAGTSKTSDPSTVTDTGDRDPMLSLKCMVATLDREQLEDLFLDTIKRLPEVLTDLQTQIEKRLHGPGASRPRNSKEILPWCVCGFCEEMPSQRENVCCRKRDNCISDTRDFERYCLDPTILTIKMRERNELFQNGDDAPTNENMRHHAYSSFVFWQHGRIGRGNRLIIPACCVLRIRFYYPSSNGTYKGFQPGNYPH